MSETLVLAITILVSAWAAYRVGYEIGFHENQNYLQRVNVKKDIKRKDGGKKK